MTDSMEDLPPLQQMSELDELTWLASHPPPSDSDGEGGDASGARLWAQQQHGRQQQGDPQQQQQQPRARIVGLAGDAAGAVSPAGLQGPVTLRVRDAVLSVRPLWIAVYQPEDGGPAK